ALSKDSPRPGTRCSRSGRTRVWSGWAMSLTKSVRDNRDPGEIAKGRVRSLGPRSAPPTLGARAARQAECKLAPPPRLDWTGRARRSRHEAQLSSRCAVRLRGPRARSRVAAVAPGQLPGEGR